MAAYIRELYLDLSLNKLSSEVKSDLLLALQELYSARVINKKEIHILDAYLSGYRSDEIAVIYMETADKIEATLDRIFTALSYATGYTDHRFVWGMRKRYNKIKLARLTTFLDKHGRTFTVHDL